MGLAMLEKLARVIAVASTFPTHLLHSSYLSVHRTIFLVLWRCSSSRWWLIGVRIHALFYFESCLTAPPAYYRYLNAHGKGAASTIFLIVGKLFYFILNYYL
jgi:hypothetical protein